MDGRPGRDDAKQRRLGARQALCSRCRDAGHDRAVQLHGGYGYLRSNPAEKLMRDSKLMGIYEGISEMQKLVIARDVFSAPSERVGVGQ